MQFISDFIYAANGVLWGPIMILLLVGSGLYLTFRLGFVQIRFFFHSFKCLSGKFDDPNEKGDITHFQALCSALSATIGTGNIAGVATAIALGGPGAVFWMWVTAIVGMATKFTSCSLALKYREIDPEGSASGGPMYFLEHGLNAKWLAVIFAVCAGLASFGIGSAVQANSATDGLLTILPQQWLVTKLPEQIPFLGNTIIAKPIIGIILAVAVGVVIIGGIKRIAKVASKVVPLMCALYIGAALFILVKNYGMIDDAFGQIFKYAFQPMAAGAGFVGGVLSTTIEKGVARGIFSNESGLGSAPIAHAAAKTKEMAREGFVAMVGPFIDTIVICTMTALVIITSGLWQVKTEAGDVLYGPGGKGLAVKVEIEGTAVQVVGTVGDDPKPFFDAQGDPYPIPTGASLTTSAFDSTMPGVGRWVVSISLIFFAYSTIIAWSYYGDRSFYYLFGQAVVTPYRYLFCGFIVVGAVGGLDLIWTMADNLNAMMAIPNLVALVLLAPVAASNCREYIDRMRQDKTL